MLRLILKKILAFSAFTVLGSALLMVDLGSPSLVSEARAEACDWDLYQSCMVGCGMAFWSYQIGDCQPYYCDGAAYCDAFCRQWSDC